MPSVIFGNHARKTKCRHGKQPLEYCHPCDCTHHVNERAYCHICDGPSESHEPTPDDLDAIASWTWSDYRAQIAEFGHIVNGKRVFPALAGIALALFLSITQIPAGCAITGHTSEGFPVANCADGTYYQDLDGQPYENAAGNPVYPAGTWIEMP